MSNSISEIMIKRLLVLNPVTDGSADESSSVTNHQMYGYKESVHSMQIWVEFNVSIQDMTEKEICREIDRFQRYSVSMIYQQENNVVL